MWIIDRIEEPSNILPNREDAIAVVCAEMRACGISETEISRWRWRARNVRNCARLPFTIGRLIGIARIVRAEPIDNWQRVWDAIAEQGYMFPDSRIRALYPDPEFQDSLRVEYPEVYARDGIKPIGLIRCLA